MTEEEEAAIRGKKREVGEAEKKKRLGKVYQSNKNLGASGFKITSSLMGAGGQDREKPKALRSAGNDPNELDLTLEGTQHTDIVDNHTLVRPELRRSEQRMFHRPRLRKSDASPYRRWMFCSASNSHGKKSSDAILNTEDGGVFVNPSSTSSFGLAANRQNFTSHKLNITKESQLAVQNVAKDESVVVLEYTEERPPLMLNHGMVSKIVNYYNGPLDTCPISAGGGDRPPANQSFSLSRSISVPEATGLSSSSVFNSKHRFLGPSDKSAIKKHMKHEKMEKKKGAVKRKQERQAFMKDNEVLPEGATQMLKDGNTGPFVADIENGETQTAIVNNLFVAPLFNHAPPATDFLLTFHPKNQKVPVEEGSYDEFAGKTLCLSRTGKKLDDVNVVVRPFPKSLLIVGQTEPKQRVPYPGDKQLKEFQGNFIRFHCAKELERSDAQHDAPNGVELSFVREMFRKMNPSVKAVKNELSAIAVEHDEVYSLKGNYGGLEKLGRMITPENVCSHESHQAAVCRLNELGISELCTPKAGLGNAKDMLIQVGLAVQYLKTNYRALSQRLTNMEARMKRAEMKKNKDEKSKQHFEECEKAVALFKSSLKDEKRKFAIAKFILEELSTTPWQLTNDLIDIHGRSGGPGSGSDYMLLVGPGEPSGIREGKRTMSKSPCSAL